MSAADPATLAAIQRVTKRCLAEIDRVCTLLDIRYVAYGGTAIGAVRHQGFIPWDDDGDVCMPRADYERFIADAPALLGEEFFPTRDVPFEDITVMIQNEYDALLRRGYGDYMQLPPPEKRYNHEAAVIDFGPYADSL